jgi:transposase
MVVELLTLHGKVDAPLEASLPWGVDDVQKKSRRRFTAEFKSETVKLVKQSDRSMSDMARELGISAKSVGEWVRLASDSDSASGVSEDERAELKPLREENSELRMEKEILRKATLGSTSQRNTFIEAFCR